MKLSEMLEGAVQEKFDESLKRVAENVQDPNVPAKAKRSITIKIDFIPDEARDMGIINVDCKESLAGSEPIRARALMGKDRNGAVIVEDVRQKKFNFDEEEDVDTETGEVRGAIPFERKGEQK